MGLSSPSGMVLASTKSLDMLPPQYKKLMADLAPGVMRKWIDVFKQDDDKGIEQFKARGMTPISYPEAELGKLRGSVKPIWDEWVATVNKQGHNGDDILEKMIRAANATRVGG
jgi:TRAP-type C4-dicarboxylate transport system substrate-binding protein